MTCLGTAGRFWISLLFLFTFLRVGEARNPGPVETIAFGAANPSGINGKALSFLDLPCGIWSIAETQATQPIFERFSRELRAFQPPARHLRTCHGGFATLRANSAQAGTWTGVAVIADCPIRPLVIPWRGHEFDAGRVMITSMHLSSHCIIGATVYGPPKGPTFPNSVALTAELLDTVSQEVVRGMSGPRYIAGDMNMDIFDLPVFHAWKALGWREAQEWAQERFGRDRQPTSKGAAIRDHLWLSPEMVQWIDSVDCLHDAFCDHSPVLAYLNVPLSTAWQFVWPQPAVLPWGDVSMDQLDFPLQHPHSWNASDLTQSFAAWSTQTESELIAQLSLHTTVPSHCRGRGHTTEVTRRPITHVPLRPGRHGDTAPRSHVASRAVHHMFKQVRRLQAYKQRARSGVLSAVVQHDQLQTWRAILRARGFAHYFPLGGLLVLCSCMAPLKLFPCCLRMLILLSAFFWISLPIIERSKLGIFDSGTRLSKRSVLITTVCSFTNCVLPLWTLLIV